MPPGYGTSSAIPARPSCRFPTRWSPSGGSATSSACRKCRSWGWPMALPCRPDLSPPQMPDRRVRPPLAALERAAELLLAAKNPAILAGSRIQESGAVGELVQLAERLGAPVISESGTTHGRLAFPCDHPLYAQGL